jgi:hypothetical protein
MPASPRSIDSALFLVFLLHRFCVVCRCRAGKLLEPAIGLGTSVPPDLRNDFSLERRGIGGEFIHVTAESSRGQYCHAVDDDKERRGGVGFPG